MVNLSIVLDCKPITTPDAEQRVKSAWRLLAEMVIKMVEGERDSIEAPVELPQELVGSPSPPEHITKLEV